MDDINNIINFDSNENRPIFDNHKVNSNDILNESAENKLSAVESAAFFQSSPVTAKQVLTSVNNNRPNEKPNSSLAFAEYSTNVISNNSEENITSLPSEAGTEVDRNNSFNLVYETVSNTETSNNISANLSLDEIPVGNVNFPPDAVSDEICTDNQKNQSNSAVRCNETSISKVENVGSVSVAAEELKDEKNNSYMVVEDLVDFSFRDQESVTDVLIGSFTTVDSVSKHPETSLNSPLDKNSDINSANKQEIDPVSKSAELLEIDCVKVPNEPATNSHKDSVITDSTENCAVVLENSNDIDSLLSESENPENKTADGTPLELEKPCKTAGEVSGIEPIKLDISADHEYRGVNSEEAAFQLSENPSSNEPDESSPLKVEKVSLGMSEKPLEQFSDPNFPFQFPENSRKEPGESSPLRVEKVSLGMSDKPLEQFSDPNFPFQLPENSKKETSEISPLKVEKVSLGMSDKPLEIISDTNLAFKSSENSSNEPDEFSPLKVEKASSDISDKPLKQFSDPDFALKLPENPFDNGQDKFSPLKVGKMSFNVSDKPLEQFSDPDFAFKVPEVPSNNTLEQFGDPEFAFKVPEKPLTNEGDEQFVDAVQFFRDPNSFRFLENIRTSTVQPGSALPRSSLYVNFDPLHSKLQANVPKPDNCELISAAVQESSTSVGNSEKCSPEVVNKQLVDVAARESLGNILISFDSPKSSSKIPTEIISPPKMFTEEELHQKLKIYELETQEAYLKKQREMEMEIAKREELLKSQRMVIEEFCGISIKFSEDIGKNQEKIMSLEEENAKLKEDLKTSAEDLQSVENTFTDFYKRYEQCKGMLKTYKDNEEHLKETILDLQAKAKEQDQMYLKLQERADEMLQIADVEMDSVKRSGEAQVTVLKAQLKKAEMKISSLESDITQIKKENSQLGGICDDLMAKVSRS